MTARQLLPSFAHSLLLSGGWLLAFELGRPWSSGWAQGATIATVVAAALFVALRARYGPTRLPILTTLGAVGGAVAMTYLFRTYPVVNWIVIALLVALVAWAMVRQRSTRPSPPSQNSIH